MDTTAPTLTSTLPDEAVARVCHEANRAYCASRGDTSHLPWDQAPYWQRESAIEGVRFHRTHRGAPPSVSHDNWLAHKRREGWRYGPVKDAAAKTHPCVLPFDQLPAEEQRKDVLFCAIVTALS
jgi:hypothetical protein